MKNIGLIKISTNTNDDFSMLNLATNLYTENDDINISLFTTLFDNDAYGKRISILPIHEAKYFVGTAIVWDLITLDLVTGFPNLKKILYIHNNSIPWRENPNSLYSVWQKLFENKRIETIITNNNIYDIFRLTWDTGTLIPELNSKVLYEKL